LKFGAAYSSDLQRCVSTAEVVLRATGLDIRKETWLREIDVGRWEGMTFTEARERHPRDYAARESDLVGFRFPQGESFADVRARVVPAFLRLVERCRGNVLVVSHKGVNRVLLSHFLGRPIQALVAIDQPYCCVSLLTCPVLADGRRAVLVDLKPRLG
jgi:broad specificity phosphatase PhoE